MRKKDREGKRVKSRGRRTDRQIDRREACRCREQEGKGEKTVPRRASGAFPGAGMAPRALNIHADLSSADCHL